MRKLFRDEVNKTSVNEQDKISNERTKTNVCIQNKIRTKHRQTAQVHEVEKTRGKKAKQQTKLTGKESYSHTDK